MTDDGDDRREAAERVDRYYEIAGYPFPDRDDPEYRERFWIELNKIREGE